MLMSELWWYYIFILDRARPVLSPAFQSICKAELFFAIVNLKSELALVNDLPTLADG